MSRASWRAARIALATALIALGCAGPATGAEFKREPATDGIDIITVIGRLEANDERKLAAIAEGLEDATVVLKSVGGNLFAALRMGRLIHERGYETRVYVADCTSACFLVWIAGKYRYLNGGRLGLHSASTTDGKRSDEANEQIRAYLEDMGAPQQVIDLWPQANPRAMNWIVYTQARDWGLFRERPQSIGRFWEMIISPPSAFYSKPKE